MQDTRSGDCPVNCQQALVEQEYQSLTGKVALFIAGFLQACRRRVSMGD